MKKLMSLLLLFLFFAQTSLSQEGKELPSFPLNEVIQEVKNGLKEAQTELDNASLPKLNKVDITFETVTSKEGKASFKFLIFSFGKKVEKKKTQTVSFTLIAPKPGETVAVKKRKSISKELVASIKAASESLKNVEEDKSVPLELSTVSIELKFIVKKSKEAGIEFEISPVTPSLSGNLSKETIHKIKVTFEK